MAVWGTSIAGAAANVPRIALIPASDIAFPPCQTNELPG